MATIKNLGKKDHVISFDQFEVQGVITALLDMATDGMDKVQKRDFWKRLRARLRKTTASGKAD